MAAGCILESAVKDSPTAIPLRSRKRVSHLVFADPDQSGRPRAAAIRFGSSL